MKGHQRGYQLPETGRSHELRSIKGMKTGPAQRRCVTDIVQPRRRDQTVRCLSIETPAQPLGSVATPRTCANRRGCSASRASASRRPRCAKTPLTTASLRAPAPCRSPVAADGADPGHPTTRRNRRLPAGFATLALLPSAGAPVRAAPCDSPSVRRHAHMHPRPAPELSRRPPQLWHHDEAQLPSLLAASRRRERQAGPTAA